MTEDGSAGVLRSPKREGDELATRKRRLRELYETGRATRAAWELDWRADRVFVAYRGRRPVVLDQNPPAPALPVIPADLRGLPCAARTRAGTPCKRTDLMENGRCKLHGGLSTGPKTPEGAARARQNLALRWNPMRGRQMTGSDG